MEGPFAVENGPERRGLVEPLGVWLDSTLCGVLCSWNLVELGPGNLQFIQNDFILQEHGGENAQCSRTNGSWNA